MRNAQLEPRETGGGDESRLPSSSPTDPGPGGRLAAGALAASLLLLPAEAAGQDVAVTGATVYPVSGPALEDATVLVRDGSVAAVGPDVQVPEGVSSVDARGRVVTPGFFDAGTRVGLVEVGAVSGTRDYRMEDDPIRAAFDVTDGINPNSTLVPVTREGGVTTVLTRPAAGLVAGRATAVDLAGSTVREMLVERRAAMVARYGASAAQAVGGARGAASLRLREALEDARFWAEHREAYARGASRRLALSRLDLEALQPVLAGEMPLTVNVHRASDILAVLRIARDFGLRLVIEGGTEAWMVREELAAAEVPVVLKPLTNLPSDFSRLGARFDNAALLAEAGVKVALTTFGAHNVRDLPLEAGNAVRYGLPWEEALRAVTLAPAEIYGLADRYGSLEPGKVGNLVVWSGDPFEARTRPETVVIRGRVMPRSSRQRELLRRYRRLPEDRPPAHRPGGR